MTVSGDRVERTLGERGEVYGKSVPNLACTEKLWAVLEEYWQEKGLSSREEEIAYKAAVKMMTFKLARIICGKHHQDNFTDTSGYGRLAEDIAEGRAR